MRRASMTLDAAEADHHDVAPASPTPARITRGVPGASRVDRLVAAVHRRAVRHEMAGRVHGRSGDPALAETPADCLIATRPEPHLPDEIFPRLRWGGVFVFVGQKEHTVRRLAESYDDRRGFVLEQGPTDVWVAPFGLRLPPLATRGYYFIARKTQLLQPGDVTDRFTYHVDLLRAVDVPYGYVVRKQVPSYDHVLWRLRQKYAEVDDADLQRRAHKLVNTVFPTFLTREAAFLKLLQRDLGEEYRCRVPSALAIEKDDRGFVRELHMNWLRNRSTPIDQLTFARQSADLLTALHEQAGIMHLDLRLDNFVLTEDGVGFVDFGSAVRFGEQFERSNMLKSLFSEMMRTSQIQRMLGQMLESGKVTSQIMREVHGKVDKGVDSFYLAVQINQPHKHPELRHLVKVDKQGAAYKHLHRLTSAILRPKNPDKADYKSAADIRRGILRIQSRLEAEQSSR
ncbi:MAG: hypothetical protein ACODAQ_11590 [Phycisphaeraceae bacterium]